MKRCVREQSSVPAAGVAASRSGGEGLGGSGLWAAADAKAGPDHGCEQPGELRRAGESPSVPGARRTHAHTWCWPAAGGAGCYTLPEHSRRWAGARSTEGAAPGGRHLYRQQGAAQGRPGRVLRPHRSP